MSFAKEAYQRFNGALKLVETEIINWIRTRAGAGSFQVVPADLTLDPAAGTSAAGDTDFLAAIMGNVLSDSLTKTNNYLAGLIGHYSVTGVRASTMPVGGILAGIGDTVTDADGAVVGYVDGDSGITKANAAFKAMSNNSTPGSGFDFGLDLFAPAHNSFLKLEILKATVRSAKEVVWLDVEGVPVDGTSGTGAGFAGKGSLATDITNGDLYINAGTKASPTWKLVTRAA